MIKHVSSVFFLIRNLNNYTTTTILLKFV